MTRTAQKSLTAMVTLGLCCLAAGCGSKNPNNGDPAVTEISSENPKPLTTLTIRWQRLVEDTGETWQTCDRCSATEQNVNEAYKLLKQSLVPLGLEVKAEKIALDRATFAKNPMESNRIWIGDDALEDLLGAKVGQSRCCSACGDSECRTITVDGHTYEGISAPLIVKAGLSSSRAQAV